MRLVIDSGNTRSKLAIYRNDQLVREYKYVNADLLANELWTVDLEDVAADIKLCCGCSVASLEVKSAIEQGFKLLGRGGTLVVVGMTANGVKIEFDSCKFASIEQRLLGSKMGSTRLATDIPWYISLYQQGRLKLDELISGRYPLEQINEAISDVSQGNALRNVIVF